MENEEISLIESENLWDFFECRIEKLQYYSLVVMDLENSLEGVLHTIDSKNRYKTDLPIYNGNRNDEKIVHAIRSDLELQAYISDLENTLEVVRIEIQLERSS